MVERLTAALHDYHLQVSVKDRAAYITKSHAYHCHKEAICRSRTVARPTSLPCVLTSSAIEVFLGVASALGTMIDFTRVKPHH